MPCRVSSRPLCFPDALARLRGSGFLTPFPVRLARLPRPRSARRGEMATRTSARAVLEALLELGDGQCSSFDGLPEPNTGREIECSAAGDCMELLSAAARTPWLEGLTAPEACAHGRPLHARGWTLRSESPQAPASAVSRIRAAASAISALACMSTRTGIKYQYRDKDVITILG
jgi:hypothetical protein